MEITTNKKIVADSKMSSSKTKKNHEQDSCEKENPIKLNLKNISNRYDNNWLLAESKYRGFYF